jgi:hypothetical protein
MTKKVLGPQLQKNIIAYVDDCWWSLNSKYNHQLLHKVIWNELQSIVVGFDFNKFYEFWCSHLPYRICNFSWNKSISNDKLEYAIAKGSSRRSKRIYYMLYLEFGIKRYQSATTHALEGSRGHEKTPDRRWGRMAL